MTLNEIRERIQYCRDNGYEYKIDTETVLELVDCIDRLALSIAKRHLEGDQD